MGIIFDNLEEKPSDSLLKKIAIIGGIVSVAIYAVMAYFMVISGTDATKTITGQLSFSGPYLKEIYLETLFLNYYEIAQTLDYVFMVSYGALLFSLSVMIARKKSEDSKLRKIGFKMAELAILAAVCDAFENMFILITLMNPLGFPSWQAIAHSCFALVKWILLATIIGYNVAARVSKK